MESLLWEVDWKGVFSPERSLAEMILRGTIMYFVIVTLLRIVVKRQTGSIASTDVLVIVLIAEIAGPGFMANATTVTEAVMLVATVLGWSWVVDRLAYRFRGVERLLDAEPVILIKDGRMIVANMRAELVSKTELITHLRKNGIADIGEVREAYMEADGEISLLRR